LAGNIARGGAYTVFGVEQFTGNSRNLFALGTNGTGIIGEVTNQVTGTRNGDTLSLALQIAPLAEFGFVSVASRLSTLRTSATAALGGADDIARAADDIIVTAQPNSGTAQPTSISGTANGVVDTRAPLVPNNVNVTFGRPATSFADDLISTKNYIEAPDINIPYGFPINIQGAAFENAVAQTGVYGNFLGNASKTFDFFIPNSGLATSTKTINTLTDPKLATPLQVEAAAKKAINDAIHYVDRGGKFTSDIPANLITSKQVVIAVPAGTTPAQLAALNRAVDHGQLNKIVVKIVITGK
jgi:hypothetical protein